MGIETEIKFFQKLLKTTLVGVQWKYCYPDQVLHWIIEWQGKLGEQDKYISTDNTS